MGVGFASHLAVSAKHFLVYCGGFWVEIWVVHRGIRVIQACLGLCVGVMGMWVREKEFCEYGYPGA